MLREHRGDGHVIANAAAGIDGLEAHVMQAAAGAAPRDWLQRARGWSDEEWDVAAGRLTRRGWLDRQHFLDLISAINFIPGPNSTELVIHIGQLRAGVRGLLVAGAPAGAKS